MGGTARVDHKKLEQFNHYWDRMLDQFPEYRREAVEAAGQAVRRELSGQIQAAALGAGAKGTVDAWQALRLGSRGGYAAVTPSGGAAQTGDGRARTWRDKRVTKRQVTKWLEKGHGVRKPAPGSSARWARVGRSGINMATGTRYVKARQFYSFTKEKAFDLGLAAADKCLSRLEDEIEYD